jgi:BlaI family transcriptional regulator, penicillinase repressor
MENTQQPPKPTESELEILQILWQSGPSSVRFINDQLNQKREVGYTTTLKIMQIMHDKGLLLRDATERSHVFSTAVEEQVTQKRMLDQLLDLAYRGSTTNLVMQALGNHQASDEELAAIRDLLDRIEKQKS